MLGLLLLAMRKKPSGGGGGSFHVLTVTPVQTLSGTSCENPAQASVNLTYSGNPSGKTLKLERDHNGAGWETVATGLTVASFPYAGVALDKYYNKFAGNVYDDFRVTDESDAGNSATGRTETTAIECGV